MARLGRDSNSVNAVGGSGNVVLLADVSMWSNVSDRPITFGDNRQFLENAVNFVAIPEPGSASLFLIGAGFLMRRRRKHLPKQ